MDIPAKKLLQLLDADRPADLRAAAALVIGEVAGRTPDVAAALLARLDDADPAVRLRVIAAIGKLRVEAALPRLLEFFKVGGEAGELAAMAAAKLGAKGAKALQELMPKVAPGLRRYIAAALTAQGASSAGATAVAMLTDKDPGVVSAAVDSLMDELPALDKAKKKAWADELLALLTAKKSPPSAATESAAVHLLIALDDPRAAAALWDRVLPPHPMELRVHALQALARWVPSPGKDQLKRLFACASDADGRVAAPALMTLNGLTVNERNLPEWLALLAAPDVAVRRLVIAKVGDRDALEVAESLLAQLDHSDRSLRDDAFARLVKTENGRKVLSKALLGAETAERAWPLAKAQAPFVKSFPAKWREDIFGRVCKFLEANDRRADPLLFLLREAEPTELRGRIEERASDLRKKKDYETASLYWRLLTRDPASGFAIRFESAGCLLRISSREVAAESRAADPALHQFGQLLTSFEADLAAALEKAKWLEPEDLYYLGFHFAEQGGRAKAIATKVLRLVATRSPKSKLAQAAKSKLKSVGLS